MALFNKRYSSFGREDRLVGMRALLKGDTFLIRLVAYLVLAGLFLLMVELTHKTPPPAPADSDSTQTPAPTAPAKPAKK